MKYSFKEERNSEGETENVLSGCSSVGRTSASQAEYRGFESRHPLHWTRTQRGCRGERPLCFKEGVTWGNISFPTGARLNDLERSDRLAERRFDVPSPAPWDSKGAS